LKKSQNRYISAIHRETPSEPILAKFCTSRDMARTTLSAKLQVGKGFLLGSSRADHAAINSPRHYRRDLEQHHNPVSRHSGLETTPNRAVELLAEIQSHRTATAYIDIKSAFDSVNCSVPKFLATIHHSWFHTSLYTHYPAVFELTVAARSGFQS